MNDVLIFFLVIVLIFLILMAVKEKMRWKFCVLCVAVSLTWLGYLVMFWLGKFQYPVVLGVLMGESVFGIYHLLEKRMSEKWHVFRLPALLTLTAAVFVLLKVRFSVFSVFGFLALLWFFLILLFLVRSRPRVREMVNRLIACCRDW